MTDIKEEIAEEELATMGDAVDQDWAEPFGGDDNE
jgi:hypothetical protein